MSTATSTPMAHHCLRPDEHGGAKVTALPQAAVEVGETKTTSTARALTAGHVRNLLQLLQDGVHARGRLLHLLSKVPQHAEGQTASFLNSDSFAWRCFAVKGTVVLKDTVATHTCAL